MSYLLSRLLGSRARFAVIGLGVAIPIALGIVWYLVGGLPRGHDDYGTVPIGQTRSLDLPDGEVRVYFQGRADADGKTEPQPPGLAFTVTAQSGTGGPLAEQDVSASLFGGSSGDIRWQPLSKIDVPQAGSYRVSASADSGGSPDAAITLGRDPWNPLGSRLVGAILVFVLFAALLGGIGFLAAAGWRILEEERSG